MIEDYKGYPVTGLKLTKSEDEKISIQIEVDDDYKPGEVILMYGGGYKPKIITSQEVLRDENECITIKYYLPEVAFIETFSWEDDSSKEIEYKDMNHVYLLEVRRVNYKIPRKCKAKIASYDGKKCIETNLLRGKKKTALETILIIGPKE